jgi:hypothetical protein
VKKCEWYATRQAACGSGSLRGVCVGGCVGKMAEGVGDVELFLGGANTAGLEL